MNIFDYIGAKVDLANQETFSYLVGWIADCINQVRTGKFKDWMESGKYRKLLNEVFGLMKGEKLDAALQESKSAARVDAVHFWTEI